MSEQTATASSSRPLGYQLAGPLARFAAGYADQNERDHQALVDTVPAGRITAERGV